MKKTTSPHIRVKRSKIHNVGVFAKKNISEGTHIIEYVGKKITKKKAENVYEDSYAKSKKSEEHGAVYLFELNKRYDVDGNVSYNTARYINHSCDPNAETDIIRGKIYIIAVRDIAKDEEIAYNYGYNLDDYIDHKCKCGSDRCIGYILAEEFWPKFRRLQKKKKTRKSVKKKVQSKRKKK